MKDTYRRDFESIEEFRERVAREMQARATFEPDLANVLDQPAVKASDLVSDTFEEHDGFRYRVRVYANGTRITTGYPEGETPTGGVSVRPGNAAANAAFKAGREDEYIDRMRTRFGGEW